MRPRGHHQPPKSHCVNGHPMTQANTKFWVARKRSGIECVGRSCILCHRITSAFRWHFKVKGKNYDEESARWIELMVVERARREGLLCDAV